jgi:hypothetical protein
MTSGKTLMQAIFHRKARRWKITRVIGDEVPG